MKVLAGDLGGTKALIGVAEFTGDVPEFAFTRRLASADFSGATELLRQFAATTDLTGVSGACLAVAGPVSEDGRQASFTNLPWYAAAAELEQVLGMPVTLVNDFAAVAAGIATLPADQRLSLQTGEPLAGGVKLAIGAGTGLGMATIVPFGDSFKILPSEGGHVGFAPADPVQDELATYLRKKEGRATAERAISGMGLVSVYRFLAQRLPVDSPDPLATEDPAATIGLLAQSDRNSLAYRAVSLFMAAYGAFAGDMALALMARGGVFLAGGVTQKLMPLLQEGAFMAAFNDKLEHAALASHMPVYVVMDPAVGLKGAATLARHSLPDSCKNVD